LSAKGSDLRHLWPFDGRILNHTSVYSSL